ncbi:hypothetical protein D3C80_1687190 [compost metagenome]
MLLRRRLQEGNIKFARIDDGQQFPLFDPLVVFNQNLGNFAGYLRRNTRDIGTNIGIIGVLLGGINKKLIN